MKPILQALVLADHIYEDRQSGKKVIAGTFGQIILNVPMMTEAPAPDGTEAKQLVGGVQMGSPYAYISITDIKTSAALVLRFVDLQHDPPLAIFQTEVTVQAADPLQTIELIAALPMLPIQHPGVFAFEVLCENELLGSFRIVARQFNQEGGKSS